MNGTEDPYLTIAEAARYIGVSSATLRRWDAGGKLRATRRAGSNYRYYRVADLEPFRLEYSAAADAADAVAGFFSHADTRIAGNNQLREPQIEAFEAAVEHFKGGDGPAIIQLPVGCGKTGLAAILPFGLSDGRVLVIAPNTTIREGLYADLNISNAACFWKRTGVLDNFSGGPYAALVDGPKANIDDCINSHIVVANIQQLAGSADRWLSQFPADFFDLVVIDEGHHVAAESWQRVVRAFPHAKFVSLTATPFRADNKNLLGELVYRYSFSRAMLNGYIKHITSASAHPEEITFTARGESNTYSLEQVMELKDDAWFRRGVALSEECNRHIAEKALEKLQLLRSATGFPHQVAASAMSIDHADQVRAIFEEMGLQAATIHSAMPDERKDAVIAKLRNNQLDCVVQVAMLGEGFDHPPLSIAAIFRPYRSLAPYIQFAGRVMRAVEPNDPSSPNNQGYVVSHVGLNNEEQWDDFRELDADDRQLVEGWTRGDGGITNGLLRSDDGEQLSHRFDGPVAEDEKLSHFLSRPFLDVADDRVIEEMLDMKGPGGFTFRELGITAGQLRERQAARVEHNEAPAGEVPVQPQARRQSLRSRLDKRSKSIHQRILTDLGLARAGFDISRAVKRARGNNADALYALLNSKINSFAGEAKASRQIWSADQLKAAYDALDDIGDEVAMSLEEALKEQK
ncbi:MAG: MerR family DNA-binding transcriptional regulator [Gammaproteobacteria bacterium]|nr:MerR family DNA-binding transcriptional regulator [Gammaproteobacteria bacterium]